jgi:hypothetical protein
MDAGVMDEALTTIRVISELDAKREARIRQLETKLTREQDARQSWDRLKLVGLLLAA